MRLVIGLGDGPCSHRWFPLPCPWGLNERVCFSPQADVVGGLVICAIGIDAVRHIRQRREFIALACCELRLERRQFLQPAVEVTADAPHLLALEDAQEQAAAQPARPRAAK